MEDRSSLFCLLRKQNTLTRSVALLTLLSLLATPGVALGAEEFFRQTKEDFSPSPFIQPDLSSGAFLHGVPMKIPQGRGSVQPELNLSYSSNDRRIDSIVGYGWSIPIPYIERLNKLGTDKLYNQNKANTSFYSSLSGELLPFSATTTSTGGALAAVRTHAKYSIIHAPKKLTEIDPSTLDQVATTSPEDLFIEPILEEVATATPTQVLVEIPTDATTTPDQLEVREATTFSTSSDIVAASLEQPDATSTESVIALASTTTDITAPTTAESPKESEPLHIQLRSLDAKARANRKGVEIGKLEQIQKTKHGDVSIEVLSMKPIDGGIQVFARAWNASDTPIGFGADGSIEIERFRIFNPPILVDDPEGDIIHKWTNIRGEAQERRSREDLQGALLEVLAHAIAVKNERFGHSLIIPGKVGNTTDIYFPSSDGSAERNSANSTWGSLRTGSGTTYVNYVAAYFEAGATTDRFSRLWRGQLKFNTADLPDGDTISSATLSLYGDFKQDSLSNTPDANIYSAPTTTLASSDFENSGSTALSDPIAYSSWSTTGYNSFDLNASGIANINVSGTSGFSFRNANKDAGDVQPAWAAGSHQTGIVAFGSVEGGTSKDPKLVIEHSSPTAGYPVPAYLEVEGMINPLTIATSNPRFSTLIQNSSTTALVTDYRIQISASSSFSTLVWDSGRKALSSSTPTGMRTPQIYSTSTFPLDGTTHYWRIQVWDQVSNTSGWSTSTALFQTVSSLSGDYMSKVDDGAFMKYTLGLDNRWTAYDKKGAMYRFGHSSSTQLYNPATTTDTFRWYLEEMRDPSGNSVHYEYATTTVMAGYASTLYPSRIIYTNSAATDGVHEVHFVRETRQDIATSSIAGFPTVTNERIKGVAVRTNGQLTKYYQLNYSAGENSVRSTLSMITESGWDSAIGTTTLPAQTFKYSQSTNSWTQQISSWGLPAPSLYFAGSDGSDHGARVFDVNGDALPDILTNSENSAQTAFINTGTGFATSSAYDLPEQYTSGYDGGFRMGDINGDGYIDIIRSFYIDGNCCGYPQSLKSVFLGGSSGWTYSPLWTPPVYFAIHYINTPNPTDMGVRLADVNGDGLSDMIAGETWSVYINNGQQFIEDSSWSFPVQFLYAYKDAGVRVIDLNADGLSDVFVANGPLGGDGLPQRKKVYLNTGHGWQEAPWDMSYLPVFVDSLGDTGARLADVNADGLPDVIKNDDAVYLGTGKGWSDSVGTFPEEIIRPQSGGYPNFDAGVVIDDINGDGLLDIVKNRDGFDECTCMKSVKRVWIKDGIKADMLVQVLNERGGTSNITYGRTSGLDGGVIENPNLQFALDVVTAVGRDPGFGGSVATTTYSYYGGRYYYASSTERGFSAFGSTTQTNSLGHTVRTSYHQGNASDSAHGEYNDHIAKIGKPYLVETLDGTTTSANLFARTINKWARASFDDGRNFTKLWRTLTQTFDGDTSHRDTAEEYIHDNTTGNVTEVARYGEVSGSEDGTWVDTGSDRASTTYTYSASSTNSAFSLPSRELLVDQSGTTVRDTKWYYDNLATGLLALGNQTKEEKLISGSTYASTTRTYNSYGLVTQATDARGGTTTFVYDVHNLFVATTTNALGHTNAFQYNYGIGKVTTSTDANGLTAVTEYDGLGRVVREKQPDITTPSTLVTRATYAYTDSTTTPSSVFRTDYLSSGTSTDLYTYLDGWGRTLQSRKEAESANGYVVQDFLYNTLGSVDQESLPYFSSGSSRTTATSAPHLFSTYRYDPMGRVTTLADALGTTTNRYSDWRLTVTDALGNNKEMVKDAYGNLANVIEYVSAGSPATTTYTWNLLGKLTKLTDALGNVRNFTYDSLGRLTGSEDLHAVSDTTFGTTSRQYDIAGNLVQLFTPLGGTVNYTYDALNRVLTEDATSTATGLIDVRYVYDAPSGSGTCTYGKGKLCAVFAHNSATTTYQYNALGGVATMARQIAGTWATTSTTYTRNGLEESVTYPDLALVSYRYDAAGLLESVTNKESGGATANIVNRMTWSPQERIVALDLANGVTSTSTYDQAKKYRLAGKQTKSGSTLLEDIAYTYDAVGNMTQFANLASTTARKSVTYTYDGLYRLLSASTTAVATGTSGYLETFTYDALGNILTGPSATYAYAGTGYANPDALTTFVRSSSAPASFSTSTITLDATTTSISTGYNAGPQTKTWTHTVSGTNPLIVLSADIWQDVAGTGSITNATWNGGAFVKASSTRTGTKSTEMWYLVATTTGAKTMSVTVTGATDAIKLNASSFTNVSPTNPLDAVAVSGGSSGNPSASLTTSAYGAVVVATLHRHSTTAASTNRSPLYNDAVTSTLGAASYQLTTTPGSVSDTYTGSASQNWSMVIASFSPATSSTPGGLTYATTTQTFDRAGNLLQASSTSYTWGYNNRLLSLGTGLSTSTYTYDEAGMRTTLSEGGVTTLYPSTRYSVTTGGGVTKHLFAGDALLATLESTGGTGTITLDATSTSISTGWSDTTTKSWTHTTAGTNRLLVLSADIWQDTGGVGTITSATYGGVSLTKATNTRSGGMASEVWYLVNPASGGNTLSVTVTGETLAIKLAGASFTGVDQGTPLDTAKVVGGYGGNPSGSITTGAANALVLATLSRFGTTDATTNRTPLYNESVTSTLGASSYQLGTSAGVYSDTYTGSASADWSMVLVSFKPASGGTTLRYATGDILSGTSLMTTEAGAIVETLDATPYGVMRVDEKISGYAGEKRKYAGTLSDQSGLHYAEQRYQQPVTGQFISQDPLFTQLGDTTYIQERSGKTYTEYLSDPQLQHAYSYARNNPITKSDPRGESPNIKYLPLAVGGVVGAGVSVVAQFTIDAYTMSQTGQNPHGSVGEQTRTYLGVAGTGFAVGVASEIAVAKGALAAVGAGLQSVQGDWAGLRSGEKKFGNVVQNAITQATTAFVTTAVVDKYLPGVSGRMQSWTAPLSTKNGQDILLRNALPASAGVGVALPTTVPVSVPEKPHN